MLADLLACAQRISVCSSAPAACAEGHDLGGTGAATPEAPDAAGTASTSPALNSIQSNLATIRATLRDMSYADLCLPCTIESLLSDSSKSSAIQFFEVLEHPAISVCLIAFPPGSCIPLHDHPGMHVFTKVMAGQLSISMLDVDHPMPRSAIPSGTSVCARNLRTSNFNCGECCELSPVTGNIHGVTCIGDRTALMLDVNLPPYADAACHYFAPIQPSGELCVIDEALAWSSCAASSALSQAGSDKASKSKVEFRAGRKNQKRR
jgi:cysteamine dioxygenase